MRDDGVDESVVENVEIDENVVDEEVGDIGGVVESLEGDEEDVENPVETDLNQDIILEEENVVVEEEVVLLEIVENTSGIGAGEEVVQEVEENIESVDVVDVVEGGISEVIE